MFGYFTCYLKYSPRDLPSGDTDWDRCVSKGVPAAPNYDARSPGQTRSIRDSRFTLSGQDRSTGEYEVFRRAARTHGSANICIEYSRPLVVHFTIDLVVEPVEEEQREGGDDQEGEHLVRG